MELTNSPEGIGLTLLGMVLFFFRRTLGEQAAGYHKRFSWVHSSARGYEIGYFWGGIVFVVFGMLSLLGIMEFPRAR